MHVCTCVDKWQCGVVCRYDMMVIIQHYSWVPVYTDADKMLSVMSISFLLDHKDDAVVWRGPKKNGNRLS